VPLSHHRFGAFERVRERAVDNAIHESALAHRCLLRAVRLRRQDDAEDDLLHHSAQRSQCISEDFQRKLAGVGITCSMSRSGNVRDNAVTESFFSTLKRERCHRRRYATRDEARADVFDYVERFYNPIRRHSMLGNMSLIAFERATAGDVA
jgi:putative transposase